ncbi:MAG: hypothetical protein HY890_06565, partial [Deltaproteobacteria bacterium]|nr:hypothetical protein [Deltaproteobacteria bacterium]
GGGAIYISTASPLIVNSAISASGAGNIWLIAGGGATGDITLNAGVSSGSGSISLSAGDDVTQNAAGDITTGGGGSVDITAGLGDLDGVIAMATGATTTTDTGGISLTATHSITQATDAAIVSTGGGNITLQADSDNTGSGVITQTGTATITSGGGDITLTAGTSTGGGNIALTSLDAGTGDVYVTTYGGAITDNDTTGAANDINADTATLYAATGIGSANALETTIANLQATNTTSGNIRIDNTGDLTVMGTGVRTLGGSGSIYLTAASPMTINSVVTANGSGNIELSTYGGVDGDNIYINNVVSSTSGNIIVDASDDVLQNSNITTGGAGWVLVAAGSGTGNGAITMESGTTTTSGTGGIAYTAYTDILLSLLNAGATGDVDVTADSDGNGTGAISDNNGGGNNINADTATLYAAEGIGSGNALETTIANLTAENTTSGNIQIDNTGDMNIVAPGVSNSGGGDIIITVASDLNINADVTADTGDIDLLASDSITQATATTVSTGGGNVNLQADADDDGTGGITQNGTATITSGNGNITLTAGTSTGGEDVAITSLDAGTGDVNVTTFAGAITDNDGIDDTDITADTANLAAATGIGTALDAIDTDIAELNATTTTGGIYVEETDEIHLTNVVAGAGDVVITNAMDTMWVSYVEATTGGVHLTALGGSILDGSDGPGIDIVAADDSTLIALDGIIGIFNDPIEVSIVGGTLGVAATQMVGNVSVIINGVVWPSDTLAALNVPPGLILFNYRMLGGGNIEDAMRAFTTDLDPESYELSRYMRWLLETITDEDITEPLDTGGVEIEMNKAKTISSLF